MSDTKNTTLPDSYKLSLLRTLYDHVFQNTISFEEEDNIGPDLAYLMGAILTGDKVEFELERPIVKVLRKEFGPNSVLWNYVFFIDEVSSYPLVSSNYCSYPKNLSPRK